MGRQAQAREGSQSYAVLILCDSALRHVTKDTEKFWSPMSQILLPDRVLLFYWPLS